MRNASPSPVIGPGRVLGAVLALLASSLPLAGCAKPKLVVNGLGTVSRGELTSAAESVTVHMIPLRWSNAYLVRGPGGAILVDAGSPSDRKRLPAALRSLGVSPRELKLVVLTHAHADHAGVAADLQKAGVKVAVGRGDEEMTQRGRNRPLRPQNATGRLIRPLIDFKYTPFKPDLLVDRELDLERFGLPGCRVEPQPGHTPGSLVVWLGNEVALVGDMMLGGYLGGAFFAEQAGGHYYHDDAQQNRRNIERLIDRGPRRILVGHGGPVQPGSVRQAFSASTPSSAPER